MITIYAARAPTPAFRGNIRDLRPMWLLEEAGMPYEVCYLEPGSGLHTEAYLAMNPFGKVPVMKDGDFTIFESAAICLYLADRYGALIPRHGTPERSLHDQWLFAAITNFEFNSMRIFACDATMAPGAETDRKRQNAIDFLHAFLPGLERRLSGSACLNGHDFQLCDLFLSAILRYPFDRGVLGQYPALSAYLGRNLNRPAFLVAVAKNGGSA